MKRRFVGAALLLALGRAAAAASGLEAAQSALAAGDYRSAYSAYLRAAQQSAQAQFSVAMFHHEGWGRPRDAKAACTWFEKAAARVPAAAHHWGDCLAHGVGREADIPRALEFYRRAADGGHLISLCSAADFHLRGRGVPQDIALGLEMCGQAAQARSWPAMLQLAAYFRAGDAVPRDLALARYWYDQAASLGAAEGQYKLALMLAQGEGGAPDTKGALYLLESAASAGYVPAYLPTAHMYGMAPVQPETGALAPEHLAKIYLWAAAAAARATDPEMRTAASGLLAQVLAVMPGTWRAPLDRQVAQHVARYATSPSNRSNRNESALP